MNIFKKVVITLFFTSLALVYTYQVWMLPYLPLQLRINGDASHIKFKAVLCENIKGSEKCQEEYTKINIPRKEKVLFKFYNIKSPEKMKLKVSNIKQFIEISDVNIVDNAFIDKFHISHDSSCLLKIENHTLQIKSDDKCNKFSIHYDDRFNNPIILRIKFIVLIPLLLFFFISIFIFIDKWKYIISNKIKNKQISDIVFLIIFLIILLLPMSRINTDQISHNEKRDLNKYKPLYDIQTGINFNYPKDFNNWINDRFLGREYLLSLYALLNCSFNRFSCQINDVILFKNSNITYSGGYKGLNKLNKKNKINILKTYADNVNQFKNFCEKNNTKLYILIVPRQKDFFKYKIFRKNLPDNADEVIDYLKNNTNTNIIYPKEAMFDANKESPVYFKTDHHWTKKGAYIGYYELMQHIKNDYPQIPVLSEKSLEKYYDNRVQNDIDDVFHVGTTLARLHLPNFYAKRVLDTDYAYYKNPKSKDLQKVSNLLKTKKQGKDYQFYYPFGANKKVMVIGNSFIGNFMEFLPYSFKYTLGYADNSRKMYFYKYENDFKEYKPDILIIVLHTTNMFRLLNLYENKYSINK